MELGGSFVNPGARETRVHRSKDEVAIFSKELKASGTVFKEITFAEVKGSFECTAVWVRGHVYHFHVMWPNKILCDHLQG
jgi:hypothetical protein